MCAHSKTDQEAVCHGTVKYMKTSEEDFIPNVWLEGGPPQSCGELHNMQLVDHYFVPLILPSTHDFLPQRRGQSVQGNRTLTSTLLFPLIPIWPGTQQKDTTFPKLCRWERASCIIWTTLSSGYRDWRALNQSQQMRNLILATYLICCTAHRMAWS